MRLRDESKRKTIIETAIKLFADRPFHKVRLDDVAAAAGIGKGTVYIYFKSKEDLYYSLIYDGFADLVKRLKAEIATATDDPQRQVRIIVRGVVDFSVHYPQLFEMIRTAAPPDSESQWEAKRRELTGLIEDVLRKGVENGAFTDEHCELTALYFTSMVRAVMLYGPKNVDGETLADHISSILLNGLTHSSPMTRISR